MELPPGKRKICECRLAIGFKNFTSPTTGPIHQTAWCQNSDEGILVMIKVASTVTLLVALAGKAASVYAGAVNISISNTAAARKGRDWYSVICPLSLNSDYNTRLCPVYYDINIFSPLGLGHHKSKFRK